MTEEQERETLRQMMKGALALDPGIRDRALEVLRSIAERDDEKRKAA